MRTESKYLLLTYSNIIYNYEITKYYIVVLKKKKNLFLKT